MKNKLFCLDMSEMMSIITQTVEYTKKYLPLEVQEKREEVVRNKISEILKEESESTKDIILRCKN